MLEVGYFLIALFASVTNRKTCVRFFYPAHILIIVHHFIAPWTPEDADCRGTLHRLDTVYDVIWLNAIRDWHKYIAPVTSLQFRKLLYAKVVSGNEYDGFEKYFLTEQIAVSALREGSREDVCWWPRVLSQSWRAAERWDRRLAKRAVTPLYDMRNNTVRFHWSDALTSCPPASARWPLVVRSSRSHPTLTDNHRVCVALDYETRRGLRFTFISDPRGLLGSLRAINAVSHEENMHRFRAF